MGPRYRRQRPVFFFSSRRRHTRSTRDWSSDVCSSDLEHEDLVAGGQIFVFSLPALPGAAGAPIQVEIGRASCRERVWMSVVAVSVKKKMIRARGIRWREQVRYALQGRRDEVSMQEVVA